MQGLLGEIWPRTWTEVWLPLTRHPKLGNDFILDFFREHVPQPKPAKPVVDLSKEELEAIEAASREYEETLGNPTKAKSLLRQYLFEATLPEARAVQIIENSVFIFDEYDDQNFNNQYFNLVDQFIRHYSLRYDLRRPLTLHPTLSGIFSSLVRELHVLALQEPHISSLLEEYEDAVRDLRGDLSQGRVKTCLQKQFNLLEALGQNFPGVTQQTLGAICGQINTWPHATIRDALRKLYGFRSDYPGVGHAGNPAAVLRDLEARDVIAIGVMLAGFVPYLTNNLNLQAIYWE